MNSNKPPKGTQKGTRTVPFCVLKDTKPKEYDITKTAGYREAMDDVKNGRVCHHDSVDDMFKSILGEEAFNEIRSSWWNDKKLSIPQKCVEKSKWN